MPPKTILVTGGTGFIGQKLLQALRYHDDFTPVTLVRRRNTTLETILDYPSPHQTIFVTDFMQPFTIPMTPAIVIHCAAVMDFYPKTSDLSENILITNNLLDACVKTGERIRFIYVSTTEVVGPSQGGDETAACKPVNAYGTSKLATEALVKSYADRLDIVIARPTGVYGPGERFFFYEFMNMVASGLSIVAPSPMSGRVVFVHINDAVSALIALSTNDQAVGGVFNITADEPASFRQIVDTISVNVGVPRPKLLLPTSVGVVLMRLIGPVMNIGKRRVFVYHPKTVRDSVEDRIYSNLKLRSLGFRPKYSVLAGVEQTVRYELENGGLVKGPIPAAFARGLHFISVLVFAVSRWAFGRRHARE